MIYDTTMDLTGPTKKGMGPIKVVNLDVMKALHLSNRPTTSYDWNLRVLFPVNVKQKCFMPG